MIWRHNRAIDKNTLKADTKQAFVQVMNDSSDDREGALDKVAESLTAAIIKAIKSADINYLAGLIAPPGGGAVTGIFEGGLQ